MAYFRLSLYTIPFSCPAFKTKSPLNVSVAELYEPIYLFASTLVRYPLSVAPKSKLLWKPKVFFWENSLAMHSLHRAANYQYLFNISTNFWWTFQNFIIFYLYTHWFVTRCLEKQLVKWEQRLICIPYTQTIDSEFSMAVNSIARKYCRPKWNNVC